MLLSCKFTGTARLRKLAAAHWFVVQVSDTTMLLLELLLVPPPYY